MNKLQLYPESDYFKSEDIALRWNGNVLSYSQFFKKTIQYITILRSKGIADDSRVVIASELDYRFPMLFFALLQLKATVVPINTRLPVEQIKNLIKLVHGQFLVQFNPSPLFSMDPGVKILAISELDAGNNFSENQEVSINLSLDQKATILFTSGSTGNMKAVLHTIGNHYYSAAGSNTNIIFSRGDTWLVTLPFYHVAGIAILFRSILAGGTIVIGKPDQPINSQLENSEITHLSLVPTQLHRLLNHGIDHRIIKRLKAVLVGGSGCSDHLVIRALNRKIPLFLSYGSTEMSSQITTTRADDLGDKITSGCLLPYREVKIADDREILVRGKTLALGYYQEMKVQSFIDKEGWFHTGDLGSFDDKLRLIVTGRKDNMFISAGENIYPEEIEKVLKGQADILNACVVPVADPEYGSRPVAFVEMSAGIKIDENRLKSLLKKHVSGIKIPIRYFKWSAEETLKPDRKKLEQLAQILILRSGK